MAKFTLVLEDLDSNEIIIEHVHATGVAEAFDKSEHVVKGGDGGFVLAAAFEGFHDNLADQEM